MSDLTEWLGEYMRAQGKSSYGADELGLAIAAERRGKALGASISPPATKRRKADA